MNAELSAYLSSLSVALRNQADEAIAFSIAAKASGDQPAADQLEHLAYRLRESRREVATTWLEHC